MHLLSQFCFLVLLINSSSETNNTHDESYHPATPTSRFQALANPNFRKFLNASFKISVSFSRLSSKTYGKRVTPFCMYRILLLFLNPDIELNPGPRPPRFPCGDCSRACTWRTPSVQCDDCDQWYHKKCMSMHTAIYEALGRSDVSWHCFNCGIPQFRSSFFSSLNSSTTQSIDDSISNITSPKSPHPFPDGLCSSSP